MSLDKKEWNQSCENEQRSFEDYIRASYIQVTDPSRMVQFNKNPSSECKLWQAGPSHNPSLLILSITMRWSLVLSTFIAVHFSLSFFCVALPILPQSDELERRAPPSESNSLKISSEKYRENSRTHEFAYHVKDLAADGKLTSKATVTKEELKEKERPVHADKLLGSKDVKYQAGTSTLLRNVRLPFLLEAPVLWF